MSDPNRATVKLITKNHPHPGIPGGSLGAPTAALLRDAAAAGMRDAGVGLSLADALALYDARIAATEWEVVPMQATFSRTPVRPIGLP